MTLPCHVLRFWALAIFLVSVPEVRGVRLDDLYGFGGEEGDAVLPVGDNSYANVTLQTPINLFGESYKTLFVSTNGLVTFLTPLETFINVQFPLNTPAIAPLYANADTSRQGTVFYRESDSETDLVRSLNTLRELFPNLGPDYQPVGIFIATWYNIGMYGDDSNDKGNTFQLAITTDGLSTFVEFLYLDGGIRWIQATNEDESLPSVRAQAGIVSPSGKLFTLKGSGSDQVINLDKWTNGGQPGQYVFKIGNVDEDGSGIVEQPQVYQNNDGDSLAKTCAEGYVGCHSDAECSDTPGGVCCSCRPTYIGNGLSCLKKDMSIRVAGPLSLNLNGIRLENLQFEGYVVVKDGRVYTAVDGLPSTLGPAMQFLKPVESIPGWLFAVAPDDSIKNGFQFTGAVLNQTASVTFSPQQVVRIRQKYKGPDAFDQIKVEIEISGRIPEFPADLSLKHPDYEEIYTKTAPGEYRATGTHKYQLNTGEIKEVQVEQTIQYDENCHSEQESAPQRLVSNRNYLSYKEEVLRLAAFHRLGGGPVFEDPCIKGRAQCVANSSCLVDGDSFKCVCNNGFQSEYYGEELGCTDINECQERIDSCHEDAICINEIGSYSCNCNSGFSGDGVNCESVKSEETAQQTIPGAKPIPGAIPLRMDCQDPSDARTCTCDQGFEIQNENNELGIICVDIDECSRLSQLCSTYADCLNFEGGFECRCHEGFRGNGQDCEPEGCDLIECPTGSTCDDRSGSPQCVCPPGFIGSPPSCQPYPLPNQPQTTLPPAVTNHCTSDSDCPQFARCLPNILLGVYTCLCEDSSPPSDSGRCPIRKSPIRNQSPSSGGRLFRTCFERKCWCPPGYDDNGQHCIRNEGNERSSEPEPDLPYEQFEPPTGTIEPPEQPSTIPPIINEEEPTSCLVKNNCHSSASCIAAMSVDDGYRCMCNPGFEGDGYTCIESDLSCAEADICHKNAVCMPDSDLSTKYVCICSEGYVGDGYICYPSGQCNEDTDCGDYGVCEYNEEKEAHECGCRRGYNMEGGTCVPERESVSCSDCDPNASCVKREGVNVCQCNDGYRGDGLSCVQIILGCDTLSNCDPNAKCLYTPDADGYKCRCNPGFEGDGLNCDEIITCYQDPSLCDQNARCLQIDDKYTCKCAENFFGNGTYCKESNYQKEEFLLLTKGGAVIRIPFSPDSPAFPINIEASQVAVGITTDCVEGKVYWSDLGSNKIKRAKYDGSEVEEFLKTSGQAEGLALDWRERQIYWTDSATRTISTANLDSREMKVIVNQNLTNPRGIAVHPYKRKLYWSDWNRNGPKIEESDLDGGRRGIIVSGNNVKLPNALTIDWDRDDLCWSNAGTKTIECMYLQRRLPNTVVNNAIYPFGVAISADRYYWTDWQTLKIMSAPKDGGTPITSIDVPLGQDKPFGLVAVAPCPE